LEVYIVHRKKLFLQRMLSISQFKTYVKSIDVALLLNMHKLSIPVMVRYIAKLQLFGGIPRYCQNII